MRSGIRGFSEDLERIKEAAGLPIEVLNNLSLKADAEYAYLDAIVEYNKAHFELYVALGQPPAACLARPVPTGGFPVADATPFRATSAPQSGRGAATATPGAPPSSPAGARSPFSPPLPDPVAPGSPMS